MTTANLCGRFVWSPESEDRNALTMRYEPIQPLFLMAMTRQLEHAVLLDVGANIGFYAVVVGSEPSVAEIHAFEPMPAAAAAARWNLAANVSQKPFHVHEVALSDQDGELEFAVRGELAGDNGAWAESVHDRSSVSVTTVACKRLDDWNLQARDIVLKIDVEGHERSTMQGSQETLARNRGFLQVEIHEWGDRQEKVAWLAGRGWHEVISIGSDHFFSNIEQYCVGGDRHRELVEQCLSECVASAMQPPRIGLLGARRKVAPGVYLELSRDRADSLKRRLRSRRGRPAGG